MPLPSALVRKTSICKGAILFQQFKINKPNLNNLYKQLKHPPALLCCRMEIVSGFLQGLGLSMLQNQSTTSHYNFPVEHKWGSPSVASGNKDESLLVLGSSNYLQTSISPHSSVAGSLSAEILLFFFLFPESLGGSKEL